MLVPRHGQPGGVAAPTPLPVDGMILAAFHDVAAGARTSRTDGFSSRFFAA
jgi:hypothetical protein